MEKLKRSLFFWTLTVLFLIVAPWVVLRARGFRFDVSRGVFVHSGSITIKSNPENVDVELSGETIRSKKLSRINNSYTLTGLLPREYQIRVTAEGFQPWDKKIDVHSGLSSEFWNILLVRDGYEKTILVPGGINKFFVSPKGDFIAYDRQAGENMFVDTFDIDNEVVERSFDISDWSLVDETRKENMEWSPDEDFLSVPVRRPLKVGASAAIDQNQLGQEFEYAYFVLDPTGKKLNLNEFLNLADIRRLRWDPREKGFIFSLSGNSLYRASLSDSGYLSRIASDVTAYELSESSVYYAQSPSQLIYRSALDGNSDKTQITFDFPENDGSALDELIVYDETRIAFLTHGKKLLVYNRGEKGSYFRRLDDDIEGLQFSNDGKKLIYWTKNEILAYFLRDWNVQPTRGENETQSITRYSEEIRNVQWFKDYEHVIFSAGPQIKLIELDSRDHRNSMDLPKSDKDDPIVIYSNSLENLFFTGRGSDSTGTLQSIVFPEENGVLGF